jgi:hypothetical protein
MSRIKNYLSQPYPLEENIWKIIIPISVFIGFFMVVFQPFGLSDLEITYKNWLFAGYGLVTFIILIFDLILIPSLFPVAFRDEKWVIWKELLFLPWILFTVGLGNLLYSSWTLGFHLTLTNVLVFQAYTLAIGIIPVTALTLIKQNFLKHKNEESAGIISETIHLQRAERSPALQVQFYSDNEKDHLTLEVDDLLFIKSDGNYITIGYLKNGKPSRVLLRNTMKYAIEQMKPCPFFFQCHRSWLVNLHKVSGVTGNSQGLQLALEGFEEDIPVARTMTSAFRKLMTEHEN